MATSASRPRSAAMLVWQDYVAGTAPTNATSRFTAKVEMKDGAPVVTWSPALNGEGVREGSRTYRVWGKANLALSPGAMRPVEQVSYNEIRNSTNATANTAYDYPAAPNPKSFLGLLRAKTGLAFDLPSEAQWEFACRAGHGTGYWGNGSLILQSDKDDVNLDTLGRCKYNGGMVLVSPGTYKDPEDDCGVANGTAIVGSYAPNSWGLYDMHGNVWEWCLDWYAHDITKLGGDVNTTASGSRVLRGGRWGHTASNCRSARRIGNTPDTSNNAVGFRVALPL